VSDVTGDGRPVPRDGILTHLAVLSGAELALLRWIEQIPADRFQPVVVIFGDGPLVGRLESLGIETHVLPLGAAAATAERTSLAATAGIKGLLQAVIFIPRLARTLRRLDLDLVQTNSLKSDLIGLPAARLAGLPLVWYLHDRISSDYLPSLVARAVRTLARFGPRRLIANSQATREALGLPAAIAYPGLDPLWGQGSQADRNERETDDRAPVIGLVGRISPTKGQREFVIAAEQVLHDHPDATFRIIGTAMFNEAAYEAEVRQLVKQRGLDARIEFCGFVPDPAAAMEALDLLVHASPVPEPFGQVIAEAMALGVPVIATDAGGAVEVLHDDQLGDAELGLLVAPGDGAALADAITTVLDDPHTARRRAAAARPSVRRRFDIQRTAAVLTSVWDEVLRR
jgi:glycosyltransferase involved in cell wall biosynthesis